MKLGEQARVTLQNFVPLIGAKLKEYFEAEIVAEFGFNGRQKGVVKEILEHGREYLLRPQKRLRPSFVYYGYRLSGKQADKIVWDAAMGVEITHAGILMHDDFMDQDEVRRGGPTTHKFFEKRGGGDVHFGDAMSVTVGDVYWCLGFDLVTKANNNRANAQLFRAIANTAYGQAYDLMLEKFENWTEDDVVSLHRAKTGLYTYENPLLIGAYLGGIEDEEILAILKQYADDGGVAFQLQDDILGVYGTPEKTGKSADSDLKQGKCTLMVLKAYELGDTNQKDDVRKVWGNTNATREELDKAKQAMIDCGAYEYNLKLAREYAAKAVEVAEKLRKFDLNSEAIDYIQGVAEYMVTREL
ncbi:MAG: polyprenyl synthetase family protein [Patescibacteria group bacterium]